MKLTKQLSKRLTTCILAFLWVGTANTVAETVTTTQFVTLGTSSGPVLSPDRMQPANVLLRGNSAALVDVGDGAVNQLAKAGIKLGQVNAVLLSHLHFDHTGGLFAYIGRSYQLRELAPVTIYGPAGTRATIEGLIAAAQPMALSSSMRRSMRPDTDSPMPGDNLSIVEVDEGDTFTLGDIKVTVSGNSHYVLSEKEGDPAAALSFRFDAPDRSIVYTGDTGPSEAVVALAKGADVLVSEVMDPDEALEDFIAGKPKTPAAAKEFLKRHFSMQHISPTAVGQLAARAGVKQLVLTHVALRDESLDRARSEIAEAYSGEIAFASDLDTF